MSDIVELAKRLKSEIETLTDEQAEVLRAATYLGMTPHQGKEYDHRRGRILSLIKELERLEKAG